MLFVLGLANSCPRASAAQPGYPNGRVAFDSVRGGNQDIYAIDQADALDPTLPAPSAVRLTVGEGADAKPSWSPPTEEFCPGASMPEPTFIAFQRTSGSDTATYILSVGTPGSTTPENPDPASPAPNPAVRIASGSAPAFGRREPETPQCQRPPIAFQRQDAGGKRDIFVATYDGADPPNVTLTNLTQSPGIDEGNPDWSADGDVAFDSDEGTRREVWVMDVSYDALTQRYSPGARLQLTDGPAGFSVNPSWFVFTGGGDAPAQSIAFAGPDRDGSNSQVHHLEWATIAPFSLPGPTETFTLTSGPADRAAPGWSPWCDVPENSEVSECRLAYQSRAPGENSEIYVMDPFGDTESDRNVTQFPGDDANPDWEAPGPDSDDIFRLKRPRGRRAKPRVRTASVSETPVRPHGGGESGGGGSGRRCRKTGTAGNDLLCGTARRDVLLGKGGNDLILGRGGNDRLVGGAGEDRIRGGPGRDKIRGGAGDDRLDGEAGPDDIGGGPGDDRIKARDRRRDRISGGPGDDRGTADRRERGVGGMETLHR